MTGFQREFRKECGLTVTRLIEMPGVLKESNGVYSTPYRTIATHVMISYKVPYLLIKYLAMPYAELCP
jgi:hypothetical protein